MYTVVFGLYVKLVQNRKSSGLTGLDWAIGFLYVVTGVTVILDAIQEFQNLVSVVVRLRRIKALTPTQRRGRTTSTDRWINAVNSTTSVTMVALDLVAQLVLVSRPAPRDEGWVGDVIWF